MIGIKVNTALNSKKGIRRPKPRDRFLKNPTICGVFYFGC